MAVVTDRTPCGVKADKFAPAVVLSAVRAVVGPTATAASIASELKPTLCLNASALSFGGARQPYWFDHHPLGCNQARSFGRKIPFADDVERL